jgi:hypothetical protein
VCQLSSAPFSRRGCGREIRPFITNIVLNMLLAQAGSHLFLPTRREEARGGHQSIWNRKLPPEAPPDALATSHISKCWKFNLESGKDPPDRVRGESRDRDRFATSPIPTAWRFAASWHLNAAAMNGQWISVSQMSQSYVTVRRGTRGTTWIFPTSSTSALLVCWLFYCC